MKTSSWSAKEIDRSSIRLFHKFGNIVIPIPFDIFNEYTDHCSKSGITANLLPENIPNVLREFIRKPDHQSHMPWPSN